MKVEHAGFQNARVVGSSVVKGETTIRLADSRIAKARVSVGLVVLLVASVMVLSRRSADAQSVAPAGSVPATTISPRPFVGPAAAAAKPKRSVNARLVAPASESSYLYGWGLSVGGRLGDGLVAGNQPSPVAVTPPNVPLVSAIAGHSETTLALDVDGALWGSGLLNGTGTASSDFVLTGLTNIRSYAMSYNNGGAVDASGNLFLWGANGSGELGNGTTVNSSVPIQVSGLPPIRTVATPYYNTLAVASSGELWTWGAAGMLGDGSAARLVPAQMVRPPGMGLVRDIQGVYGHVVALTEDGELWA